MIKVNLLPQDTLAKGGAAGPSVTSSSEGGLMVALVGVLLIGGAIGVFAYFQSQLESAKQLAAKEDAAAKAQEAILKQKSAEWAQIEENLRVMRAQKAVIEALDPPNRLLWTKKLNMMPGLVPENLFLTDLVLKEQVDEQETPESVKAYNDWVAGGSKGTPPVRVRRPVINQTFEISGLAYSPDNKSEDRLARIREFFQNLERKRVMLPFTGKEEAFIDGFTGDFRYSPIEGTTVGDREVSQFTVTLRARPVIIEVKKDEPAGATTTTGAAPR